MTKVKAVLIKPLDGQPEGTELEFDKNDFDSLKALGAVRAAQADTAKKAPAPRNKKAPEVQNKATS